MSRRCNAYVLLTASHPLSFTHYYSLSFTNYHSLIIIHYHSLIIIHSSSFTDYHSLSFTHYHSLIIIHSSSFTHYVADVCRQHQSDSRQAAARGTLSHVDAVISTDSIMCETCNPAGGGFRRRVEIRSDPDSRLRYSVHP